MRLTKSEFTQATIVAVGIVIAIYLGSQTLPIQAVGIVASAAIIGYIGWFFNGLRYPTRSKRVLATYLLGVGFQLIHMAEEYLANFPHGIVELFSSNRDWSLESFLLVFVFTFGSLYFFAGAGALYRIPISNYFIWFYALGLGLLNGIAHIGLAVINQGYFPGLYTAPIHIVLSCLLLYFLISDGRQQKLGKKLPASNSIAERTL